MIVKEKVVIILIFIMGFSLWACASKPAKEAKPETTPGKPAEVPATTSAETKPAQMNPIWTVAHQGWNEFKDPAFAGSTNDLSCNSCHPYGGKDTSPNAKATGTLLLKATSFPKVVTMAGKNEITLDEMVNFCITNPLKGTALDKDDPKMKSMVGLLKVMVPRSLKDDALPIINAKCAGCHSGSSPAAGVDLTNKETAVQEAVKVRELVDVGKMPKGGTLTDQEYLTLIIWGTTEVAKK